MLLNVSLGAKLLLVRNHCSNSYNLEQLAISEIGNQPSLVITLSDEFAFLVVEDNVNYIVLVVNYKVLYSTAL